MAPIVPVSPIHSLPLIPFIVLQRPSTALDKPRRTGPSDELAVDHACEFLAHALADRAAVGPVGIGGHLLLAYGCEVHGCEPLVGHLRQPLDHGVLEVGPHVFYSERKNG